jgi:hypothetical protein
MVDAAEWLARRRLLCVWKEPTLYQLISSVDFARACEAAIDAPARAWDLSRRRRAADHAAGISGYSLCVCGDVRGRAACRSG